MATTQAGGPAQSNTLDAGQGDNTNIIQTRLQRLTLTQFRNYPSLTLKIQQNTPQFIVLTGPNGAGKTNILEAVSLLSPGRGLRRAKGEELLREQATPAIWGINATLQQSGGQHGEDIINVGTGIDAPNASRKVVIDEVKQTSQRALEQFAPMVWLTPRMDRLFQEGAADRRRFLDRLVYMFFPAHAPVMKQYEHALSERNKLIKQGIADPMWFAVLEQRLVQHGVMIAKQRQATIELLQTEHDHPDFPDVSLAMQGRFAENFVNDGGETLAKNFQQSLGMNRRDPPHFGPHRDDMQATHVPKNTVAGLCSTGEQKAILISLLLAQGKALRENQQKAPIFLLDEVAAHLDDGRRVALFEEVAKIAGQAWLTGTDAAYFESITENVVRLQVDGGEVILS